MPVRLFRIAEALLIFPLQSMYILPVLMIHDNDEIIVWFYSRGDMSMYAFENRGNSKQINSWSIILLDNETVTSLL